jgi:branched-chain amino acid transport system substrate-binding protein
VSAARFCPSKFMNLQILLQPFLLLLLQFAIGISGAAETVKIGVLAPMTGPRAEAGRYMQNGLRLAGEEIDGDKDRRYRLQFIFQDTSYLPRNAVNGFHALKEVHKVDFIIGAGGSSETLAVAPLAEKSATVLITPSSQSHLISSAGDYIFRLVHNTAQEAPFFAEYVAQHMRGDTLHFVALETDITPSYLENFLPALERAGKKAGLIQEFAVDDRNFRPFLLRIKQQNPTDILLLTLAGAAATALRQAQELDIRAQYYTLGVESPELVQLAGRLAEGIIYPYSYDSTSAEPSVSRFYRRYHEAFNEPPDAVAANSYDAAVLLSRCFERVGVNVEKVKFCLYGTKDFAGAGGTFSIDSNGDAVKRLYIKTIRDGKFVLASS